MAPTASTLESDLNSKIQQANERRKEDVATTKRELLKIEELVTKTYSEVSKGLQDHDTGLTLFHEGQMHLGLNLNMLMNKMGVTHTNSQTQHHLTKVVEETELQDEDRVIEGAARDLDGDFQMLAADFDGVMEEYSRERNKRDHVKPPPHKAVKQVITPQNQTGSNAE